MTPDAKNCLDALDSMTAPDGDMCVPFAPIMSTTGLDRKHVRRCIRGLARKGLAEYFRGLFTEDGEMAGAGYCITREGRALVEKDAIPLVYGRAAS
jgi:predicted transcriptional regulator